MKILLEKLAGLGLNRRQLTESDFFAICEAEGIEVVWSEKKFSFYFSALGEHCIVLPKRLRGLRLQFAMWHEFGHYAAHSGSEPVALFEGLTHSKDEAEADAIALVALMPIEKLRELAWLDGSRFGSRLYNERLRLYFLFGI